MLKSFTEVMLIERFKDKVHTEEIIKWGVFDGALVGGFIAVLTILYEKREQILALSGWEYGTSLFLFALVAIGAIVTTTLTFAHPIYSLLKKEYKDAGLTVLVSLLTIIAMTLVILWSRPNL